MRLFLFLVVVLGILTNCSTLSKRQTLPPSRLTSLIIPAKTESELISNQKFLDGVIADNEDSATRWWAKYSSGLLWRGHDNLRACGTFRELSIESNFPIAFLADIRAMETCPPEPETTARLKQLAFSDSGHWAKKFAVEISLKKATSENDRAQLVDLYNEQSKFLERQGEKIELVKKALDLAEAINAPEEKIKNLKERLYLIAPRLNPDPSPSQWGVIADDFRRAREFQKARHYYRLILSQKKRSPAEHLDALKGIRQSYKLEGARESYVSATEEIFNFSRAAVKRNPAARWNWEQYNDAGTTLIRTLWTEGQLPRAKKILEKLITELRGKYSLTEPYWIWARMAEEQKDFSKALEWSEKALAEATPGSAIWETILWQKAWNSRKQREYSKALAWFQKLRDSDTQNKSRYAFWHAKTLKEGGDPVRAHADFELLTKTDPLSWYAILAQRELGAPFAPLKLSNPDDPEVPSWFANHEGTSLRWMISVGEQEIGREYLKWIIKQKKAPPSDFDDNVALAQLHAALGDNQSLLDLVNRWSSEEKKNLLDINPELLFPRPWYNQVGNSSRRWNVPMELVYAIMRQESAFNPLARSTADAFGLMQLTPETARSIASTGNLDFSKPEDLYTPDLNIPLGTAQLRHTLKKFKDQMILAIASYNASEKAVAGWVNSRFREDPIEFIEDIPYSETTMYVKLVLRNFIFYQRLNSKGAPVPFPEWCLNGLQNHQTASTF